MRSIFSLRTGAVGAGVKRAAAHLVDAARAHDLRHACRKVALELCLLRQVADLVAHESVAERDAALLRCLETEQSLDECGLTRAVFADHTQQIAARDREVHVAQHRLPVIAETDVFTSNECHSVQCLPQRLYVALHELQIRCAVCKCLRRHVVTGRKFQVFFAPVASQIVSASLPFESSIVNTTGIPSARTLSIRNATVAADGSAASAQPG